MSDDLLMWALKRDRTRALMISPPPPPLILSQTMALRLFCAKMESHFGQQRDDVVGKSVLQRLCPFGPECAVLIKRGDGCGRVMAGAVAIWIGVAGFCGDRVYDLGLRVCRCRGGPRVCDWQATCRQHASRESEVVSKTAEHCVLRSQRATA